MQYKVYQVADINESVYAFRSWRFAEKRFSFADYRLVYEGETEVGDTDQEYLEYLYYIFNACHPHDYAGRSMSMSDIVELNEKYFYCDTFGWKDITTSVKGERS